MNLHPFTLSLVVAITAINCQAAAWQPASGHKQISIWPGNPPDSQPISGPETTRIGDGSVAGKPVILVERVSEPTLTVYSAKGENQKAAIVIFPGGGYQVLAMDLEGTEVCDWFTAKGITCILVKYRVPGEGKTPKSGPYPKSPTALQDAQRAISLVRFHAHEWNIDPHKIGVLGFSAGGHLVAATSTQFENRLYSPVDEADKESCRPDFAIAIYPGHLWNWTYVKNPEFKLNPAIPVSKATPPTFLIQAENDPMDPVEHSLVYYRALKDAGVPVEMHLYSEGGHAFGLRQTESPITEWPTLAEKWLHTIGMVSYKD